jgi:hypothetical protein
VSQAAPQAGARMNYTLSWASRHCRKYHCQRQCRLQFQSLRALLPITCVYVLEAHELISSAAEHEHGMASSVKLQCHPALPDGLVRSGRDGAVLRLDVMLLLPS